MTREDMLRELELLPVWQLREPLPSQSESALPQSITTALEVVVESTSLTIAESLPIYVEQVATEDVVNQAPNNSQELQVEETTVTLPKVFTHIASDDGHWLFVLPNGVLQTNEEHLLHNIFRAMRIKVKSIEISANIEDVIKVSQPKLLVAMGEATVQTMLQTTETLANLRGKLQRFQGVALVVTYDLNHLLQSPPDKEKAWHDLCFAMQTLQNL